FHKSLNLGLSKLRQLLHLSASSINSYIECSLQYKLSKIDHIKQEFTADVLIFGSAIHRVLESFHESRMYKEILPLSIILKTFEMFWEDELSKADNVRFKTGCDAKSLLNTGKSLLTTYYDQYPKDDYRVLATEIPFAFTVKGIPESIIGALDLLEEDEDGTIIITDHKTAGRAFSIDEVEKNMQLTIYYMAMKQQYPDREIILKLDTLIKTKKPRFEQFYTYRSEIDEIRTIKKIKAVWQGIQNGTFIPNDTSWKCPGCAYQNHCNEWFEQQEEAV
ncbi:MAG: PD-(D/E)XK nuclease family protein, partial [Deltaproteobacteria bacterium]|nr:PD-(D/E)XK nuclease family protein [Deltaproteobacteria bacterium]